MLNDCRITKIAGSKFIGQSYRFICVLVRGKASMDQILWEEIMNYACPKPIKKY